MNTRGTGSPATASGTAGPGVEIYDVTLRDGAQGPGISFSVSDKLKIAARLDDLGVDYIEGGWPGANPKDSEFFAEMRAVRLEHARLAAFGATRRQGVPAEDDLGLRQLLDAGTPVVTLVGKSSARQVVDVIQASLEENLAMIGESIAFLRAQGREAIFDAEHFFDGHAGDPGYALRCVEAALSAGASRAVLCDTNGGTLPERVHAVVTEIVARFGAVVGIHCHDDAGVGVACTLAAVRAGAVQVQGCLNGYGERVGNANLTTIIPNLQLKMGIAVVSDAQLRGLAETSQYVHEIANVTPNPSAPYVGEHAFTHKGGQHVDAMMKAAYTYQHVDPELVGNHSRIVVSEQSGRGNIVWKARERGIDLGGDRALTRRVTEEIKRLEHHGYSFEGAEASFEMVVHRARGHRPLFELVDLITLVEQREGHALVSEATVKLRVDGRVVHTAGEGNGPVNALDAALRKALLPSHPEIDELRLHDYKVRVIDGHDGTAAGVRVLIESGDRHGRWSTVGCSTNIIEASWLALADAAEYGLLKARARAAAAGAEAAQG
ncbi:MAG TPA: citramalate synthase [Candidatus Dormibacteraeota bacterium]|nr:citramalate synthase [Candidatus Dormibacteraeota bacterium]